MADDNKTKPTNASVKNFIAAIQNKRRQSDTLIALELYKKITGLNPVMWGASLIGFGSFRLEYETGRKSIHPAACFSPRSKYMVFYVGLKFKNARTLYSKLGKHRKSKACLYVNKLDDIDLTILNGIIAGQFAHNTKKIQERDYETKLV